MAIWTVTGERLERRAEEIEEQAAKWLCTLDRDGSPEMRRQLEEWLDENARHRAAFVRLSVAWQAADALRRLRPQHEETDPDLLAPDARERPGIASRMLAFRKALGLL